MAKPGNSGSGKHWKTSDFNKVIMTDKKYDAEMGQKMDNNSRSKGESKTDYSKEKE